MSVDTRTPEQLRKHGITITVDERGKRHIRMKADPFVLLRDGRARFVTCSSTPEWVPRRIDRRFLWPVVAVFWLYGRIRWGGCRIVGYFYKSGSTKWIPPHRGLRKWTCPVCRERLKPMTTKGPEARA